MDCVLSRIKSDGKKKVFKLLSNQTLFEDVGVNLAMCVEYNPDHNLDEDSWFKIEQFSEKKYCLDILKADFVAAEYDDLPKNKFTQIHYLCAIQEGDFYFQKVTPSLFITRKMIAFGEVAALEQSDQRLAINIKPDAVYFENLDTLAFKSLATISSIFKGIDELYKEATDAEVVKFLNEAFIRPQDDFNKSKVSKPNRKRIALAMNTLAGMSEDDRNQMLDYVNSYCAGKLTIHPDLQTVMISTDDELKLLLYGIEQRFYTTPFGKERRLANSVQLIT